MPRISVAPPISVPGISGSYAHVDENHRNAHSTANPQGAEPLYGSGSGDALGGAGVGGLHGACVGRAAVAGRGSGTNDNCMWNYELNPCEGGTAPPPPAQGGCPAFPTSSPACSCGDPGGGASLTGMGGPLGTAAPQISLSHLPGGLA